MSVNRSADSIYDLTITSPEDIERALNHSAEVDLKILDAWDPMELRRSSLEKAPHYLKISAEFASAYWGSLGFSTCPEVVKEMGDCQELLRHSVGMCNDILTPLLIESFKAHRRAMQCYTVYGPQADAMAAMAETGTIARSIENAYEKLARNFRSLTENLFQRTIIEVNRHTMPMHAKRRELEGSGAWENSHEKPFLESSISSLDSAFFSLMKINTALKNVEFYWRRAKNDCSDLTHPDLADPSMVEACTIRQNRKELDDFYGSLTAAEKVIHAVLPDPELREMTLIDVVGGARTGRNGNLPATPKKKSFVEALKAQSGGIKEEFDRSYFKWLALARINQVMVAALTTAIEEIEATQRAVLRIERDPLTIALHQAALLQ